MPEHHRAPHHHPDTAELVEEMLELLRADGGRITTGRRAIVQALMGGVDHHVTADDIASAVQAEHPDVHLSTVYRTLDALERLGAVNRLNLGAKGAVYHLADPAHAHHHLVCEQCGAVIELTEDTVAPLEGDLAKRYGFAMSRHALTITGRCSNCS